MQLVHISLSGETDDKNVKVIKTSNWQMCCFYSVI